MKWGIRRYQNKDGSLTEEGKKRYIKSFEGVWHPNLYDIGDNKRDRYIADWARMRLKISKEDWDTLYSGNKKAIRSVAEKLAKNLLGDELYNTKIADLSPNSPSMTYGEFEVHRQLYANI